MKEKYIEERFEAYHVFGEHSDGAVDVASASGDIVTHIRWRDAETLIQDRRSVLDMLVKLAQKLDEVAPEEFKKIWY